jgi:Protein of unknown function DUF115
LYRESGLIGLAVRPPVRAGILASGLVSSGLRRLLGAVPMSWMTPGSVRQRLRRNIELRNRHAGQRCFILGNGPSLANEDVALLRDELLITCNQGQIFAGEHGLTSHYHAFVDAIFLTPEFDGFLDEMIKLQVLHGAVLLTSSEIATAIRARAPDLNLFETHQFLITDYVERSLARNPDLTESQFGFLSVIHMALTFAIYMGFKEIFLLGCDVDYFLKPDEIFEHSYGEGPFGETGKTAGQLFGWRQADMMKWCLREFREFEALRRIAEGQGCHIVNAGTGGALHVFERRPLSKIPSLRKHRGA